jgi:hypothetical protein
MRLAIVIGTKRKAGHGPVVAGSGDAADIRGAKRTAAAVTQS